MKFIVAEVSKTWSLYNYGPPPPTNQPERKLLSQQFQDVINTNAERGYKLIDWKMTSVHNGTIITETIIAIFEKTEKNDIPLGPVMGAIRL